jgi:dTDP-4-amino-4,6-dideoxygalactose transaminase
LIEDAAHAIQAFYDNQPLGSFGNLATLSFHETKNVTSGEGGALLINDPELIERSEIIADKGTDRARFLRGETQKYVWQSVGSSYRASEIATAFLHAQLTQVQAVTQVRLDLWNRYHSKLAPLHDEGLFHRPIIDRRSAHNAHMYYIIATSEAQRDFLLGLLGARNIHAVFHYVPLHSSPAGRQHGRVAGPMEVTDRVSSQLLRLPLFPELSTVGVDRVVDALFQALRLS